MYPLGAGINRHYLAEGLDPLEQDWLAQVINAHLEANRGRMRDLNAAAAAGGVELEAQVGSSSGVRIGDFLGGSGSSGHQQ